MERDKSTNNDARGIKRKRATRIKDQFHMMGRNRDLRIKSAIDVKMVRESLIIIRSCSCLREKEE